MFKDIYFLNVSEISNRIRQGEFSQAMMLKQFILFSILFYSGFNLPIVLAGEPANSWLVWRMNILTIIVQAVIHYYGIWYTYQINAKGDGKDYLNRVFCLALPISIRLLFYILLVVIAIIVVFFLLVFINNIELNDYFVSALTIVLSGAYSAAFYYLVGKYIRVCSGAA
ncbi:hypothetical protein [Reinekea thalattae]|uniref:Transmembrane protein n=1 Tax=Reinekea thalattae TaxID=2593301 RepID=A0A5C8Z9B9_9GAMM|nr:hypothetical protein [Reinekea thalattae]TXR53843.1 hypothetical protein FME95_04605 [Reinekea thalattae]